MGKADLIPLNKRSKEEAFAIRSKGGKTVTKRQVLANRINAYKRVKPENKVRYFSEKIEPFLKEPALFQGVMLENAILLAKKAKEEGNYNAYIKLQSALNDTFRSAYGNKNYNMNLNVDIDREAEVMFERMAIMNKKMKEYNKEKKV